MNRFVKKFLLFPLLFLVMFFSTFLFTGCLCSVVGDNVATSYVIAEDSALFPENTNFKKLIGFKEDTEKDTENTIYLQEIAVALLGTVTQWETFKKALQDYAKAHPESSLEKFFVDYAEPTGRFSKIEANIDAETETKDIRLPLNVDPAEATEENSIQKTKIPTNWNFDEKTKKISVSKQEITMEFGITPNVGDATIVSTWVIELELDLIFNVFNGEIVYEVGKKLEITNYVVKSINSISQ